MKTLAELARVLEEARQNQNLSYKTLASRVGLTPLALSHALNAKSALRANNLMALADELGLEMVLLPKVVAQSVQSARSLSDPHRSRADPPPSMGARGRNVPRGEFASASPSYVSTLDRVLERLNATEPNRLDKRLKSNRGQAPLPPTSTSTPMVTGALARLAENRKKPKAHPGAKKAAGGSSK